MSFLNNLKDFNLHGKASLFAILAALLSALGISVTGIPTSKTAWLSAIVAAVLAYVGKLIPSPADAVTVESLSTQHRGQDFLTRAVVAEKKTVARAKGFGWGSLIGIGLNVGAGFLAGQNWKQAVLGGIFGGTIGGVAYASSNEKEEEE